MPPPVNPGVFTAEWLAPDGTTWPLMASGLDAYTMRAITGIGVGPVTITADPDPVGGTNVRHMQADARHIVWPMRIRGTTHMEFLTRWREHAYAFAQTRRLGPGRLRITRPDGSTREIYAIREAGFEVEPGQGWLEDTVVIGLYCEDPFWRSTEMVEETFTYAGTVDDFLDPYPMVSSSTLLGATTAINVGNVEAWPVWTLTGPADEFTAMNLTTGLSFTISYSLDAAETLVVTTRPASVTGPAGENLTNTAPNWPEARFWRLEPGDNEIDLQVLGAAVGTSVTLSFTPGYETS